MHTRTQLFLTALVAALACALAAGAASANRSIEIRGGSGIQAEGRVSGGGEERSFVIACDITLLRTVTTMVPKIGGTSFGKVTGIAIDRGETTRSPHCRVGSAIRALSDVVPLVGAGRPCSHRELGGGILLWDCSGAPAELWKLIYDSFQGTLPSITGVNVHIKGYQDNVTALGPFGERIECLYEGNVFGLLPIRQPESTSNSARVVETNLSLVRGSAVCPDPVIFEGSFTVRPTITIRLI